jgi:hypothetical protein
MRGENNEVDSGYPHSAIAFAALLNSILTRRPHVRVLELLLDLTDL